MMLNGFRYNVHNYNVIMMQNGYRYKEEFNRHYQDYNVTTLAPESPFGQACYDAIWILTLALNNTINGKKSSSFTSNYYTVFS